MSYIYFRGAGEVSSAEHFSDIPQSVPLSVTNTEGWCSSSDSETAGFPGSRYGTKSGRLMVRRGVGGLMLSAAGSRARDTARQLRVKARQRISGRKWDGSWQMSLPHTFLPRTPREGRLIGRQTTSRRWDTKPNAVSFPRKTWVLTTFGSDTGYLHTPTCIANYSSPSMQKWPACRNFLRVFGKPSPTNAEWLMGWPIGWTDLKPLGMDRFHAWWSSHGDCFSTESKTDTSG